MNKSFFLSIGAMIFASSAYPQYIDSQSASNESWQRVVYQDQGKSVTRRLTEEGAEPIRMFSDSCAPAPDPNVVHAFSREDLQRAVLSPSASVVVAHGLSLDPTVFPVTHHFTEVLPVFVNERRGKIDLSYEEIVAILTGRIGKWEELDAVGGEIRVYLHGGELQKPKFAAFLSFAGIGFESKGSVTEHYVDSYEELELLAASDPNAVVFGLANWNSNGLVRVTVDGWDATRAEETRRYPLKFPMYIGINNRYGAAGTFANYMREVRQRSARRMPRI